MKGSNCDLACGRRDRRGPRRRPRGLRRLSAPRVPRPADQHRRRRHARRERRRHPRAGPALLRSGDGRRDHPGGDAGGPRRRLPRPRHLHGRARDRPPRGCADPRHDVLESRRAVRRRPLRRRPSRGRGSGPHHARHHARRRRGLDRREHPHGPRPRLPRRADLHRRAARAHRAQLDGLRLHRLDDGHHGRARPAGCRGPHARRAPARARRRGTRRPDPRLRRHRHLERRPDLRECSSTRTARSSAPLWSARSATAASKASPRRPGPLRRARRTPPRLLTPARCRRSPLEGPA